MADIRYYGNVMTTTKWRLYVTMETLCQQQDGGYALLWERYDNNKMAAICYYGNVMTTTRWRLYVTMETLWQQKYITSSVYDCTVEDVEYIYNKLSIHIFNSKSRRYLNVGITFP